ncbi:MAG TPA: LytTR family DNA-binding domain-containing protein [Steroidobacteraceae bacterium]|nr:LytTR family DNA-binding domain-containing protein [Steroidobacteraceae bacterium]HRX89756.1 LytTR family DNA-binding domain-containing protein [Steroidobacteraceae bacterium]
MKVVIVDDEPAARRTLREYCAAAGDLEVTGEYGDGLAALRAVRLDPPHLLFLDIQMDALTGLQLARELPSEHLPMIVFVTAYDKHAVEAFALNAIDYLLKPFDDQRFAAMLERVRRLHATQSAEQRSAALLKMLQQLEQRTAALAAPPARLLGEANGRLCMLEASAVEVIEADRNYVTLRANRDAYHARSTLAQAEQAMASEPMLRISRSCLVNTRHIAEVSRTPRGDFILVTRGGVTVTSSEGHRDQVREYLNAFQLRATADGASANTR